MPPPRFWNSVFLHTPGWLLTRVSPTSSARITGMGHKARLPFNFLYLPTSWEFSVCFLQPFSQLRHLTVMQLFHIPRLYLMSPIYSMGKFKQHFQSFKAMSSPGESKHCPYIYEAETHALNYFSLSRHAVAVGGSTTGCWGKRATIKWQQVIIKWQQNSYFKSIHHYQVYRVRLPEPWEEIASPQN